MTADDEGERLQKTLARLGFGSRRVCDNLVIDGRVRVNGELAEPGRRIDPLHDTLEVDGVVVGVRPDLVYYLLHKPAGVVTTAADTHDRPTVVELVPTEPRVFPVGRLDMDTEGLLLLTNDGDLAHRLAHPSFGVDKEYLAHVEGEPHAGAVGKLRKGVELEDGMTAKAKVALLDKSLLRITIHEGRNRQVRRMCEAVGFPVVRLVRTRIGPLRDPQLKAGEWRALENTEVRALEKAVAPSGSAEGARERTAGSGASEARGPAPKEEDGDGAPSGSAEGARERTAGSGASEARGPAPKEEDGDGAPSGSAEGARERTAGSGASEARGPAPKEEDGDGAPSGSAEGARRPRSLRAWLSVARRLSAPVSSAPRSRWRCARPGGR